MLARQFKTLVAIILVMGLILRSGALLAYRAVGGQDRKPIGLGASLLSRELAEAELGRLQGTWKIVDYQGRGERMTLKELPPSFATMKFEGDRLFCFEAGDHEITFKLDVDKKPRQITLIVKHGDKERRRTGIYELDGDGLRICANETEDMPPPDSFDAKDGSSRQLIILKRDILDSSKDLANLQGTWEIVAGEFEETPLLFSKVPVGDERRLVVFNGRQLAGHVFRPERALLAVQLLALNANRRYPGDDEKQDNWLAFSIDASKNPKTLDIEFRGKRVQQCIYQLTDDGLKIGFVTPPKIQERPTGFVGPSTGYILLRRYTKAPPAQEAKESLRIGELKIVGNDKTPNGFILRRLQLYPGQSFDEQALKNAEKRLADSKLFVVDLDQGIRPTVRVSENEDNPGDMFKDIMFKDILVTVTEIESPPWPLLDLLDRLEDWLGSIPIFGMTCNLAAAFLRPFGTGSR